MQSFQHVPMKNIIILDKIFKVSKGIGDYRDHLWICTNNEKHVATLRIYPNGIQKGNWYLKLNGGWLAIRDQNKSKTVKVMVLNYILTNFNNL